MSINKIKAMQPYRSDEKQPVGIIRPEVEFYRVLLLPEFLEIEIKLRVTVRLVAEFQSALFERIVRHFQASLRLRGHPAG